MNILSIRTFVATAALAVASFASVQAQSTKVTANVPFSFTYAGHIYTPGQYEFNARVDGVVERNDARHIQTALARHERMDTASKSTMTFDRADGRYFLRQIAVAGSNQRMIFPELRSEKLAKTWNVAENQSVSVVQVSVDANQ
jgi:hypothetical protein